MDIDRAVVSMMAAVDNDVFFSNKMIQAIKTDSRNGAKTMGYITVQNGLSMITVGAWVIGGASRKFEIKTITSSFRAKKSEVAIKIDDVEIQKFRCIK